jgi:hypothetical protein
MPYLPPHPSLSGFTLDRADYRAEQDVPPGAPPWGFEPVPHTFGTDCLTLT